MKYKHPRGGGRQKRTSAVEVANISKHGFWLLIDDKERFVPFKEFPWFQNAAAGELLNVELASPRHMYWPDLDLDLAVESIDFPERFPLVSKQRPQKPVRHRHKNGKQARPKVAMTEGAHSVPPAGLTLPGKVEFDAHGGDQMSDVGTLGPLARSILAEALKLSVSDRVTLVERILCTFDKADPALDLEWLKEAEARLAAYRSGDLAGVDAEQVFEELGKRT